MFFKSFRIYQALLLVLVMAHFCSASANNDSLCITEIPEQFSTERSGLAEYTLSELNSMGVLTKPLPRDVIKAYIRSNSRFPRRSRLVALHFASQLFLSNSSRSEAEKQWKENKELWTDQLEITTNSLHKQHDIPLKFVPAPSDPLVINENEGLKLMSTEFLMNFYQNVLGYAYSLIRDFQPHPQDYNLASNEIFSGSYKQSDALVWQSILSSEDQNASSFWVIVYNVLSSHQGVAGKVQEFINTGLLPEYPIEGLVLQILKREISKQSHLFSAGYLELINNQEILKLFKSN